uniref:EOG090X09UC n=1 Tax=Lynceus sp. MCZ IZ 141354 TaxID=1930659 RepID=A0A9N6WRC7_9CRUS|nr:EOG090X09UC [Lynceus sp. MCZ IZ 141354]
MTTLARWHAHQKGTLKKEKRPYLASECEDLGKCEFWRREILREISKKVTQIQNAGLGEFRIRDLNDEINKLLREKYHWEVQISKLGGPNYRRSGPKFMDKLGREVPGSRGYRYFGAARDLPGVRELFEQEPPQAPRKTRAELMKDIDADYYGYRDDDDGVLVPLETEAEKAAVAKAVAEWKAGKEGATIEDDLKEDEEEEEAQGEGTEGKTVTSLWDVEEMDIDKERPRFVSHVPVPTQKDIEEALLRRKKQELLNQYMSSD